MFTIDLIVSILGIQAFELGIHARGPQGLGKGTGQSSKGREER